MCNIINIPVLKLVLCITNILQGRQVQDSIWSTSHATHIFAMHNNCIECNHSYRHEKDSTKSTGTGKSHWAISESRQTKCFLRVQIKTIKCWYCGLPWECVCDGVGTAWNTWWKISSNLVLHASGMVQRGTITCNMYVWETWIGTESICTVVFISRQVCDKLCSVPTKTG